MRVVMLDFDGVLNSASFAVYSDRLNRLGLSDTETFESFCPIASSNLQFILEELPDVQIVVTSTWRKYNTIAELQEKFKAYNLSYEKIIGVTPVTKEGYRGKEIDTYLKDHPEITNFVIIDDDSDMEPYMHKFVKTNSRNGLTFTDAEKVIEMLGGKDEKEGK